MNIVECKNISKSYGKFKFENASFSITKGKIIGLVGENGAGKTTLIHMLLNKIKRDTGEIFICGKDLRLNEIYIKQKLGVVLDNSFLPDEFSVNEVQYIMKDIYVDWNRHVFSRYIELFSLPLHQKIGSFSKGMKRKLDIAIALSHNAEILIFDELTNGLDLVAQKMLLDILREEVVKKETTILLSTHNIMELKEIVDVIVILNTGKIEIIEDKESLIENYYVLEENIANVEEIKRQYHIDKCLIKEEKISMLIDKRKNKKCVGRKAKLEEIIYIKIKGDRLC